MRRVVFRGCRAKGVGSTETLTLDFAAYRGVRYAACGLGLRVLGLGFRL